MANFQASNKLADLIVLDVPGFACDSGLSLIHCRRNVSKHLIWGHDPQFGQPSIRKCQSGNNQVINTRRVVSLKMKLPVGARIDQRSGNTI